LFNSVGLATVAVRAPIHSHFNQERHLYSRSDFKLNRAAAFAARRQLGAE
jgi:putative transposase